MYTVITIIHVLACLFMIGVVLLQQGKGADMGAVFGGSSQTLFGSSGAGNFLTRMTAGVAAVFMVTSLTLAWGSARRVTTTIFDDAPLADTGAPVGDAGSAPAAEGAPAPEGAPVPEGAPAAAPAPQANAGASTGGVVAVDQTGKEVPIKVVGEVKEAEQAVADAAQGVAAKAKEGAEAAAADVEVGAKKAAQDVEKAAKAVDQKAEGAAEAVAGGEVGEAPGQADPVPPETAP